jgi:hypothetical protein
MTRLLRHLVPLAGDRLACAVHFFLLAAVLSAANVMLGAIASALFLVERGPDELPLFYLMLAAASIPLASALSMVIDRWSRIRLFQGLMLVSAAFSVALWLLAPLGLPAVPHAIYLASYALDINGPLLFWVLASEYFTTLDLKRSTVALAMGLAFGGALGGGAVTLLYEAMGAADLLLLLPPLFLAMIGQAAWLGRRLEAIGEVPAGAEHGPDDEPGSLDGLRRLSALMLRYRLALLTAASLLLVTVLYCFQQYLVFIVYAAAFSDPDDLGRFLAALFAGLQVAEFVLLYAVSRPLMTKTGPVLRNAVFPLTTLASLGGFALTFQLPAAVLCHGNIEAVSNAVYEPVRTLNHTALPLRVLGRVRTVADGMIYPAAIALSGALLLVLQAHLTLPGIAIVTLVCGVAFLAVEIALGRSFLPTLVRSLRAGALGLADVTAGLRSLPASFTADVRHLLEGEDPESRAVGLALALRLDPGAILEPVCALTPGADPTTRRAIAAVLARAHVDAALPVVRGLLTSGDPAQQALGLQVALARGLQLDDCLLVRLCATAAPPVAMLARLAASSNPLAPTDPPSVADLIRGIIDLETGELLIETIALARRPALAGLVVAIVRDGTPPLRTRGLAALADLPETPDGSVARLAVALSVDANPAVRAGALRLLAGLAPTPGRLARLVGGLEDSDRRVRREAAEAWRRTAMRPSP